MDEKLEWLIEGRVLYAARSGQESMEALRAFSDEVIRRLESEGQPPLHLVWHMAGLEVGGVDRRGAMLVLNRIMKHPNLRWFVVVDPGMSALRRRVSGVLMRLSGIHFRTVDSVPEGEAFLKERDTSLTG